MKYIKNLEDQILTEGLADEAAEISGLDSDAVGNATKELDFAAYLELGNAVNIEDADRIREILNISEVVPADPVSREIDLEEDDEHPEDQLPYDPTMLCSLCGGQGYNKHGNTCTACVGQGRVTLAGEYIEEDRYEDETEECMVCYRMGSSTGKDAWDNECYACGGTGRQTKDGLPAWPEDSLEEAETKSTYKVTFNNGKSRTVKAKSRDEAKRKAVASADDANPGGSILIIGVKSIKKLKEADNPSAPATAAPAPTVIQPPSAGSSIDNLAKPADTAADEDEVQQRKEVDDLQVGDEIEVTGIDGQPVAGRVRNIHGPGNTIVITGKDNEEHMIRKDSILSTPLIPVQEKQQSRLDKTNLGKKNKRAERVENKKQKDIYEVTSSMPDLSRYMVYINRPDVDYIMYHIGRSRAKDGEPRFLKVDKATGDWQTQYWKANNEPAVEYGKGSGMDQEVLVDEYEIDTDAMREAYESALNEVAPPGMEDWIMKRKPEFKKRYGAKWEEVLYATAWKQKNNESIDEGTADANIEGVYIGIAGRDRAYYRVTNLGNDEWLTQHIFKNGRPVGPGRKTDRAGIQNLLDTCKKIEESIDEGKLRKTGTAKTKTAIIVANAAIRVAKWFKQENADLDPNDVDDAISLETAQGDMQTFIKISKLIRAGKLRAAANIFDNLDSIIEEELQGILSDTTLRTIDRFIKVHGGAGFHRIDISNESIEEPEQKPYVSKDNNGWHVLNANGSIVKTFSNDRVAQTYLNNHWRELVGEDRIDHRQIIDMITPHATADDMAEDLLQLIDYAFDDLEIEFDADLANKVLMDMGREPIAEDVGDKHQKKIAIDTVKNPNKALLGGPSAKEAEATLRDKFGYDDKKIAKLKETDETLLKNIKTKRGPCDHCNGTGKDDGIGNPCIMCAGSGYRNYEDDSIEESLSFFVDPLGNGKFEVRSDRGDSHDVYDSGEEAVRAAKELNDKYGEIDENYKEETGRKLKIGSMVTQPLTGQSGEVCKFVTWGGRRRAKIQYYGTGGDPSYFYVNVDDRDQILSMNEDKDLKRLRELAGINEAQSGNFNSKMIGQRVKIMTVDSFGNDHIGEEGVVHRASREHTFSQMVPFIIEYGVELDNGKKITIRRESVRKIKQVTEMRRGNETNAEEMRRLKRELRSLELSRGNGGEKSYLRLEIRKLQGEIDLRKERAVIEAIDEFDIDTADMFADTNPKRKVVEIVREILKKHKIEWRGGSWEGSRNVKGYRGRDGRKHLEYPEFLNAATSEQIKLVTDEISQELPQAEINMDSWGLSVITETASGGATGAGAIASSPVAMNGIQSRNQSIYGQTKLKKKPVPKKRPTKEDASEGVGREKKT